MNLKNRIEKLEGRGHTEATVKFVGEYDWMPSIKTVADWQAACKLVNAKYAEQKRLEAAAQSGR